jgi:hypothetical protein
VYPGTGNYIVIHSNGRETAYNVWDCMAEEALNTIKMIFEVQTQKPNL